MKKLNLRVRRDGSVAVSIPLRMDWAQADRFVAEQAQWIAEAQTRQLARAERQTETPLPPKEVALAYFTAMSDAVYPPFAEVLGGQKPTSRCGAWSAAGVFAPWQSGRSPLHCSCTTCRPRHKFMW